MQINKTRLWRTLFLIPAALLGMSACAKAGNRPASDVPQETGPQLSAEPAAQPTPPTPGNAAAHASPGPDETAKGPDKARKAYASALEALLTRHVLPDGTDCGYDAYSDPAGNQFAVADVDQDGRDELIVLYTTTVTAGHIGCVFSYDDAAAQLDTELCEYPLLTFYDNGVIKADWSHNQGLAGSFWPYTLYRYDPASDRYESVGMADAWERDFAPTDAQGNPFPAEVDVSGTGFVYYLMNADAYAQTEPVDEAVYKAWLASNLRGAAELQIAYSPLTAEAIAVLGAG